MSRIRIGYAAPYFNITEINALFVVKNIRTSWPLIIPLAMVASKGENTTCAV
jgi:hypothetical protein